MSRTSIGALVELLAAGADRFEQRVERFDELALDGDVPDFAVFVKLAVFIDPRRVGVERFMESPQRIFFGVGFARISGADSPGVAV